MAVFMGIVDVFAAILLFVGFNSIPGPDWLKWFLIIVLLFKGAFLSFMNRT